MRSRCRCKASCKVGRRLSRVEEMEETPVCRTFVPQRIKHRVQVLEDESIVPTKRHGGPDQ